MQRWNVAVRAEVCSKSLVYLSCVDNAWEIFVGYADARVGFTVLQQDVIAGIPLLDKVVFKQEGILFRVYDDVFYIVNLGNKYACLEVVVLSVEVTAYPSLQVLCLADVDDSVVFVKVLIAAGQFG